MLVAAAMKVGFSGGLVVDYPHSTRAKKCFLVLMVGTGGYSVPQGKDGNPDDSGDEEMAPGPPRGHQRNPGYQIEVTGRERKGGKRKGRGGVSGGGVGKDRAWVVKKKDKMRRKGMEVKPDSKYTARKRRKMI
jgi:18S rRNA (guanine1575-N7)-methyltransferase